jgi:hypothetical protein
MPRKRAVQAAMNAAENFFKKTFCDVEDEDSPS